MQLRFLAVILFFVYPQFVFAEGPYFSQSEKDAVKNELQPDLKANMDQILRCAEEAVRRRVTLNFKQFARARCPGGGCFLQSSSCNKRTTNLTYVAPSGYEIESYSFIQGPNQFGTSGDLQVERNAGRIKRISIRLECHPPDYLGAPGGWNEGRLSGTLRYIDINKLKAEALAECSLLSFDKQ